VVVRSVGHSEATRLGETWVKPTSERSGLAISPRSRPSGEPILAGIDWGTAPFDVEPNESADYYTRLERMEEEAKRAHSR
jgi:hypothetical protein